MIENFMSCTNAIAPIFILVAIGVLIKKLGMTDDGFTGKANNLVFKVSLPAMLFTDIATIDITKSFDGLLVGYAVGVTLIMFVISIFLALPLKDNKDRAAFAQGVFRSNYAILGVPLTKALFPPEAAVNASVILSVCVPIYNLLAVALLTSFLGKKKGVLSVIVEALKNPLIIASALGAAISLSGVVLPQVVMKPVEYLAQMCVPLSLLVIGASFVFSKARETFFLSAAASIIKTLIVPLVFIAPAFFMGIQGEKAGVLYLFLAAPVAVTSYTMTRNMGGNEHMSGNIVLISTALSFFTIFFGILIMKNMGIIS